MTVFEKFILCYEAKDFEQCGIIAHGYIDTKYSTTVPFPVHFQSSIASLTEELQQRGEKFQTDEQVEGYFEAIAHKIVVGPGRPDLNN